MGWYLFIIVANVLQLGDVADFEALNFLFYTKVQTKN